LSITGIRQGIEANLETISGFRAYSEIPENPQTPCAVVVLQNIDYDQAFQRGLVVMQFQVTAIVSRFSAQQAQENLNDYADNSGSKSIKVAIESDKTLSGSAFDVQVSSMTGIGNIDLNDGNNYLSIDFSVTVYAN